jgi:methionine synthase I (cobalamin-dependent)
MGIREELKKQALGISRKAVEKLMADEKRALAIAGAIGSVQRGKQALDRGQEELMRALNFAPRGDFKALGKKLAGLKRRVRELDEKLEEIAGE